MAIEAVPSPRASRLSRDLPPLVVVAAALVLLSFVLPSALHVPQQDPSPVLEYAPVPPSDDEPPNTSTGNLASLSLGSSSTLTEGVSEPPPPPPLGQTKRPVSKRCVGNPPRQTEDPMSPPCVPFFEGDNGGATFQGVTRDEVRVVVYFDFGSYNLESSPGGGTYIDLDRPPKPSCQRGAGDGNACDNLMIRITRALARYFNDRFQTYGRRVHYWVYFTQTTGPEGRRADAADNWQKLHPFAAIDEATFYGSNEEYEDALAARRVMSFTSQTALPNSFFRKYPPYVWGFWPDVEHWAEMYVSYICTKVAPYPVRRMGNPPGSDPSVGGDRVFGLFHTSNPSEPGLLRFADLVKKGLRRCGVAWAAEQTFPGSRFVTDATDSGADQARAVAAFRSAGVTTVLYLGGVEGKFSQMAHSQEYYPEIVVAGDLNQDNNVTARNQDPASWQNAWAVHYQLRFGSPEETPGFAAYREAYPDAPLDEARYANDIYRDHFALFQSIQVAGPRLTPDSVDRGFHAIPPKRSASPYVASCFFDPGDYTCVKDATEIWWDQAATSPGDGQPGCWRMVRGGRRVLPWRWEGADDVFRNPTDPCTGFDSARRLKVG